jgi:GAF domain-containing protein
MGLVMKRPSTAPRSARKAPARKASVAKSVGPAKAKRGNVATDRNKLVRIARERDEALEQQKATAEILKVISQATFSLQAVLEAVVSSAVRLCDADTGIIRRRDGDVYPVAATFGFSEDERDRFARYPAKPDRGSVFGRAILEKRSIHVPDLLADRELNQSRRQDYAGVINIRSGLGVPLLRQGTVIGVFTLQRRKRRPYTRKQIELVETFANQAVIAIENTRLFAEVDAKTRDLSESLAQQTATADVLKVISRSTFDLGPALDALVETAARLCDAEFGYVFRLHDGMHWLAASFGITSEYKELLLANPFIADRSTLTGRVTVERRVVHVEDSENDPTLTWRQAIELGHLRTGLGVPLMRQNTLIGVIALYRSKVERFSERQITLLTTFADQAVIAVENARLFDEVQARTRELTEALEQQTATSEVLAVISSSTGDAAPVFQKLLENATRVCSAEFGTMNLFDGASFRNVALYNVPDAYSDTQWDAPIYPHPASGLGTILRTHQAVHIEDLRAQQPYLEGAPAVVAISDLAGARTLVIVPMLKEDELIGTIAIYRKEVRPFDDKQIELLTSFASQAVIAIENTRLLKELHARTDDLSESLQQQTATSEVLKVVSSSVGELEPVFTAMLESAARICDATNATVYLRDGDSAITTSQFGPMLASPLGSRTPLDRKWVTGRAMLDARTIHVRDLANSDEYPRGRERALSLGHRATLGVPLIRDGAAIGAILLRRAEAIEFTPKQIELVTNFASQAVIAIENTRLLKELRARTDDLSDSLQQQTATADVLKVIASSPTEVGPALQAVVESACKFCNAYDAGVVLKVGNDLHFSAHHGPILTGREPRPLSRDWVTGRSVIDKVTLQISDFQAPEAAEFPEGQRQSREQGHRCTLATPLLRDGEAIGALVLRRLEPVAFTDKQVRLLKTFADQAVIAIQNVRLFEEVQAKTRDLEESLVHQTGSANILKVIASSQTDIEPVLKTIVDNACEICDAADAIVYLKDGDYLRADAHRGSIPIPAEAARLPISRRWATGRSFVDKLPIHIRDLHSAEGDDFPDARYHASFMGHRAVLAVPLLREGESIGAIVLRRAEVKPFTDKQIALLQTFADQAVIAIGNTRLFEEVQARTRDLSESLQQQTATADVLKVISASPGELEPVFQALLENAVRLCGAQFAMLFLSEGNQFNVVGRWNLPPAYREFLANNTIPFDSRIPVVRAALTKRPVQVPDMRTDQSYIERVPVIVAVVELGGARTLLQVPMLKEDALVGTVAIYRQEVGPFTDKQVALVQNFAAQAVIAIENARLLNELRQRTEDLSRSLEDLRTAQDRLVQTEKLASLGQLTAGIAHEIKNPLNFVNNFSALSAELVDEMTEVLESPELDEKKKRKELDEIRELLKSNLEKVVQHGKRADSIVKNMLLHSRQGSGEHRPVDINALVDESLNLAYHGARAEQTGFNIVLQRHFDLAVGMADVYPQEITRVLLNLISNGFYATARRKAEAGDGFEPTLSAATKNLGDKIEICIRDNGTGIPSEVKEKIFNPFFTTKPAGEGTGLGLSMSHDIIVKQHGGTIDVDTLPGAFTEFRIVLPRTGGSLVKSGEQP